MQKKGIAIIEDILSYLKLHHGYARMKELKAEGFQTRDVRDLLAAGQVLKVKPGLYRLAHLERTESSGLVEVCLSIPKSVICLTTALAFHDLTTFVPTEINFAIPRASKPIELRQLPTHPYYFSDNQYRAGIEALDTPSGPIRIYNPEKTICDMFRFKNKTGSDLAFEALKGYLGRRRRDLDVLMGYAEICRVKSEMAQYLRAILG